MSESICAIEKPKVLTLITFIQNLLNIWVPSEALNTLLTLFNLSWNSHVPASCRKYIIFPIAKKGKPLHCPESYRRINRNSIIAQVMERMVNGFLLLEHHDLLTDTQSGCRIHQSTNQHVIRLSQAIKYSLDRSET